MFADLMAETNLFCIIFSMSLNDERVLSAGLVKWKKRARLVRNNIITKLIYKITILIPKTCIYFIER